MVWWVGKKWNKKEMGKGVSPWREGVWVGGDKWEERGDEKKKLKKMRRK